MCTILLQEENTQFKLPLCFVCWLGYDIDDNPSINLAIWFSETVSIYFSKDETGKKGVRHVLMNSSTAWALTCCSSFSPALISLYFSPSYEVPNEFNLTLHMDYYESRKG